MDYHLTDKVALVTGSTAGIGFAIANQLAGEGATVIINGRTEKRVIDAIEQIKSANPLAKLIPAAGDLGDKNQIKILFDKIPAVDILINNLGFYEIKEFIDITDEDWLHIFNINVLSGVRLSRLYLPVMMKKNWGRIIFISSESGIQIPAEMIHYGMTKAAQLAVSRGIAESTTGTNITVNCVLPGPTSSEGVLHFVDSIAKERQLSSGQVEKEFFTTVRPTSLLKRFTTPEEVANLVVYLASPISSGTNGAAMRVDGGVIKSIT